MKGPITGPGGLVCALTNAFIVIQAGDTFSNGVSLVAGGVDLNNARALGDGSGIFTIGGGTYLRSSTANTTISNTNRVSINGDFTVAGANSFSLLNGAANLGTATGTTRTITVTNSAVTLTLGPVANGTTANGLSKAGIGTLTLNGVNTYTGATMVNGGTLNIKTASTGGGSFATADGATLGVTMSGAATSLPVSSLALGSSTGGDVLNFSLGAINPTAPVIADAGALAINGPATINVTGTGFSATTPIVLISYGSGGSGNFVIGSVPTFANYSPSIVNTGGQVKLVYVYAPLVRWAVGNGDWDTTTLNWTNAFSSNQLTNYVELSPVVLDDTATGTSPITINLTAARTPSVVTNNSTKNYILAGSGISGSASLNKSGTGTLTLLNANTFAGGTTISAGTLQLGDGSANSGSVTGNISDNGVLAVANPTAQTISGVISGTGILTKSGAGTLTLTASSSNSGGTTISAGTLQLGDGSANNGGVGGIISNNAALVVANPTAQTITNVIAGTGTLTKSGSGALTLTGKSTYSGATTINGGALTVNTASTGVGSFTVANGNTLGVTVSGAGTSLTNSSLTLGTSAATTLTFNLGSGNPTAPLIVDTGALTLGGTVTVNVTGTGLSAGTVVLLSYGSGGAGTFVAGSLPAVAGNNTSLIKDTVNKQLKLVFAPLQTTVWQSPNSSDVWDVTTPNWTNASSANALTTYFENSPVQFDDTAPASPYSPIIVSLDTNHFPGNILVTNSALIYEIGGAGIAGVASLTKTGNGYLQLDNSNSYSGGTLLSGGQLIINNTSALGNPLGSTLLTITNTGSLNLNLNMFTNPSQYVVISGTGVDSTHGAIFANPGQTYYRGITPLTGVRNLSLAGDASIGGPGNSGPATYSGVFSLGISYQGQEGLNGSYVGSLQGNGHKLTVIGGAQVAVFATNATPFSEVVVDGGSSLMFERTAYGNGNNPFGTNCTILIQNNSYIDTWDLTGPSPIGLNFANNFIIGSGSGDGGQINEAQRSFSGNACFNTYNGAVTLNGPLTINNTAFFYGVSSVANGNNGMMTFNGVISGTNGYGITMAGPSLQSSNANAVVYFNATNTYNGPTELQNYLTLFTTTRNQAGGSYLIDDNAALDVLPVAGAPTLQTASLTIGSASGAQFGLTRMSSLPATPVVYATNLTINGSSTIALPPVTTWSLGTYHLIKYEGTVGGAGVAGLSIANLPLGVAATLVDNTGNHSVDLVVSDLSGFNWVGNVNNNWDIGGTANWITNSASTAYVDGSLVTFNNNATNFYVNVSANVAPVVTSVNTTSNYVFGGTFSIGGSGVLVKSGSGILTVSNVNTYTGGTILNSGEIDLATIAALGTGTITVNGGILKPLGGLVIANNLSFAGPSQLGGSGGNTWTGPVNLNGAVQTITNAGYNQFNAVISNGGLRLEKPPGYQYGFWLGNTGNSYANGTFIDGPQVDFPSAACLGTGPIEVVSSSWLVWESAGIADISGRLKVDDGANVSLDTGAFAVTFTNALTCGPLATAAITKLGTGTLTLAAVNTNSGSTTISAGTLALASTGGLPNTYLISIAGGATFDVSALGSPYALNVSETLSNNASATGTINGSLNTGSGTVSASYANGTPSLTVANGTPSLTVANGTLTLSAGTVFSINNTGAALAAGSYKVISKGAAGLVAGTAPTAVTTSGGGVVGTATLQIISGELYLVVSATAPTPTILPPYLNGSHQLVLAVASQAGFNYLLLSTTNLTAPVVWITNSTTAGTGGTITNLVPVSSVPADQFFRYLVQ